MRNFKKIAALILASILSVSAPHAVPAEDLVEMILNYDGRDHLYSARPVHLVINGREIDYLPMPPVIINDYTLVPVKEVFEAVGAVVDWKADTREVYIGYENTLVILQIGNPYANVNGRQLAVGTPPRIINDKTMVPLRFASESVGLTVNWDGTSRTAYIDEAAPSNPIVEEPQPNISDSAAPQDMADSHSPIPQEPEISAPAAGAGSSDIPVTGLPQAEQGKDVSPVEIREENHELTYIDQLVLPTPNGSHSFHIIARGPISKVDKIILPDNRLVIDITNSEWNLTRDSYAVENSSAVSRIRTSQFQNEPEKITRFVFDLTAPANYSIALSPDRRTLSVDFPKNAVTDISFDSDGTADYIYIEGLTAPAVNVFPLTNPNRIVIDVPYSDLLKQISQPVSGVFSSSIRASQFDPNTARVVLDIKAFAKYEVDTSGNRAIIKLVTPTYKNIMYDSTSRTVVISKAPGLNLDTQAIGHRDQYTESKYILTLPGDYSSFLGYGDYMIQDYYLNSIVVQTNGGNTELVFNQRQILAYNVSEDSQNIYIHVLLPKEKYSRIVVIDPGHGGDAPGAIHNGMIEKDLVLDYAKRLIQLIEQDGRIKVYSTRLTDVNPSFDDRVAMGNKVGDIFVSIHANAAENTTAANGVEIHYYPHSNDAALGFSTKEMAEIMLNNILAGTGAANRKTHNRPYLVIKNTEVPSVLCEMGFMTNPQEAALLGTAEYRQKGAEALYKGILEVFETYNPRR